MIERILDRKKEFEGRMDKKQKQLYKVLKFFLKLVILSVPFYIILSLELNLLWLRRVNAGIVGQILALIGIETEVYLNWVFTESLSLDVSRDSTAWKSMFAVAALVLATEKTIDYKLKGVIIGVLSVFMVNLLRISSMVFMVEVFQIGYEFIHTFLWRWGLTFYILIFWISWLKYGEKIS